MLFCQLNWLISLSLNVPSHISLSLFVFKNDCTKTFSKALNSQVYKKEISKGGAVICQKSFISVTIWSENIRNYNGVNYTLIILFLILDKYNHYLISNSSFYGIHEEEQQANTNTNTNNLFIL